MANVKLNIFNLLDQIELECMYFGRRHIIYIIVAVVCAYNKDRSYREDRSPDLRFSKMSQRSRSRSPARDKCDNRDKRHGFYNNGGKGKGKPGKGYSKNNKGKDVNLYTWFKTL